MAYHGRARIDYTSAIPAGVVSLIEESIASIAVLNGFFCYRSFDRATQQEVFEVSSVDRNIKEVEFSDTTLVSFLKFAAEEQGLTPAQMLSRLLKSK